MNSSPLVLFVKGTIIIIEQIFKNIIIDKHGIRYGDSYTISNGKK